MNFNDVKNLIDYSGKRAILKIVTNDAYDPETSDVASQTDTESGKAAFINYKDSVNNPNIVVGRDRKAIFLPDAENVIPTTQDKLNDGEVDYSIVDVKPIEKNGVVLAWILQVRL
jgi:hypothetical protein